MFWKKGVLKNIAKITGKHSFLGLSFIEAANKKPKDCNSYVKASHFWQKHACLKLTIKKQEQCFCACYYLFICWIWLNTSMLGLGNKDVLTLFMIGFVKAGHRWEKTIRLLSKISHTYLTIMKLCPVLLYIKKIQ